MVATDSYRLSVKETQLETALRAPFEVNVPARALQELARIAAGVEDGELSISVLQNQVVFRLDGITLSSRLIEGQFPNYRQLLPDSFEHELRLCRRRAHRGGPAYQPPGAEERSASPGLRPGELTVSAQTPDVGEASESLPVAFQGEGLEIGFNPDFLRDGLEAIGEGDLLLKLISPLRPGAHPVRG